MEEEKVNLETAKLAKEKGFDWKVVKHYKGGELIYNGSLYNFNNPEEQALWSVELTSAPTQSLLQKWLRENYDFNPCIVKVSNNGEFHHWVGFPALITMDNMYLVTQQKECATYEEALELQMQEKLRLIPNK